MQGAFVTVEIFLFCGWCFSNQFDIMSETHCSCDTVGREMWLAILSPLLCPEMYWDTRESMVMFLFQLILKVMFSCFIPCINQCVNSYFQTGES